MNDATGNRCLKFAAGPPAFWNDTTGRALVAVVCHSVVIEALTGHTETAPCGAVDYELPDAS